MECLFDHAEKAAMEDTDLGLRATTRVRVGRTSGVSLHDEGAQTVLTECREKVRYGTGISLLHRACAFCCCYHYGSPSLTCQA